MGQVSVVVHEVKLFSRDSRVVIPHEHRSKSWLFHFGFNSLESVWKSSRAQPKEWNPCNQVRDLGWGSSLLFWPSLALLQPLGRKLDGKSPCVSVSLSATRFSNNFLRELTMVYLLL